MEKCKYADTYTAKFPPRCYPKDKSGKPLGEPCKACKMKWDAKNRAGARRSARFERTS